MGTRARSSLAAEVGVWGRGSLGRLSREGDTRRDVGVWWEKAGQTGGRLPHMLPESETGPGAGLLGRGQRRTEHVSAHVCPGHSPRERAGSGEGAPLHIQTLLVYGRRE